MGSWSIDLVIIFRSNVPYTNASKETWVYVDLAFLPEGFQLEYLYYKKGSTKISTEGATRRPIEYRSGRGPLTNKRTTTKIVLIIVARLKTSVWKPHSIILRTQGDHRSYTRDIKPFYIAVWYTASEYSIEGFHGDGVRSRYENSPRNHESSEFEKSVVTIFCCFCESR